MSKMKIQFLGVCTTGGGANTSFVVNENICFEMGGGNVQLIKKYKLAPKYVIVSHYHPDHFADVAELLIYNVFNVENQLLFVGDGIEKRVRTLCEVMDTDTDFFNVTRSFVDIKDQTEDFGEFVLTAKTLTHGDIESNAYVIEIGGKKLGYTGDVNMSPQLLEMLKLCDKWIIECTHENKESLWHLNKDQVEQIANMYPDKTFYAVHRRKIEPQSKCKNIVFPNEGEVIEI